MLDFAISIIGSIAVAIIGALAGGLIGYRSSKLQWESQLKLKKRNLASALILEMQEIEQTLKPYANAKNPSDFQSIYLENMVTSFYPDYGLYYEVKSELFVFNPELCNKIRIFYTDLLKAERGRRETFEKDHTARMRYAIDIAYEHSIRAFNAIPDVRVLLEREVAENR